MVFEEERFAEVKSSQKPPPLKRSFRWGSVHDCYCKHVLRLNTEKSKKLFMESQKINYDGVMWGYTYGINKDCEMNRLYQIFVIQKMITDKLNNSVRIILDENNNIWIDNLHTAIKHILLLGNEVKIKDIKCFLIDMKNKENPLIINYNQSLSKNLDDINEEIRLSQNRLNKINKNIININYTIKDFIDENDLKKDYLFKI